MTDPVPKQVTSRFKPTEAWICRECGYRRNYKAHPACLNCGRDFYGVPTDNNPSKPPRIDSEFI